MLAIPLSYLLGGHRLQRRQQVADQAADTDALTGLSGCRPFRPTLEAALISARNPGREVALALIDIDEFKQVNDRRAVTVAFGAPCAPRTPASVSRRVRVVLPHPEPTSRPWKSSNASGPASPSTHPESPSAAA